jgi:CubicO group peptidase (beta-lactamase class C family)
MRVSQTVCLLAAIATIAEGQTAVDTLPASWSARARAVEAYVESQRTARRIPGLTIGIAVGDSQWVTGFGLADLENETAATARTAYRIASVTKPMTAVAVLQLAEQGRLDLDAPIQRYVPYFPRKPWPITVRQLLGHLSGITDYGSAAEERITEQMGTRQSIAIFEDRPLVFEPGTDFYYTSYGYNLLGAAIEEVTGQSFAEHMLGAVWNPLGMVNITMDDPVTIIPHRARGYRMESGRITNSEFVNVSSRGPAGGTRGTAGDLVAFGRAMYDRQLLSAATYEAMWSAQRTTEGQTTGYALGWDVSPTAGGVFRVSHTGAQQETSTVLHVYPSRRIAIAIAANLERADVSVIANGVFQLLTGEATAPTPYVRTPGDASLLINVLERSFTAGRARFERGRPTADSVPMASFARLNGQFSTAVDRRQPPVIASDDDLARIGAFIAMQLETRLGPEGLTRISREGPIGFFAAWSSAFRTSDRPPKWARLDDGIEARLTEWSRDWKVTMGAAASFPVVPGTEMSVALSDLHRLADGRSVYPDFSSFLTEALNAHSLAGHHDVALAAGRAVQALYPSLANPSEFHGAYGLALLAAGERDSGTGYLRRAHDRNANGFTGSARLARIAAHYAQNGMPAAALAILEFGKELHPRSALIRYQLGEVLNRRGDTVAAARAYEEALDLNPAFPNALEARERLRRLTRTR